MEDEWKRGSNHINWKILKEVKNLRGSLEQVKLLEFWGDQTKFA